MSKEEILKIINSVARKRNEPQGVPTRQDWNVLRAKFQCDFDDDFICFMDLVSLYHFPGEHYSITQNGMSSENGSIASIYDQEMSFNSTNESYWNSDLIPFYGLGNGDCFCLNNEHGIASSVHYVYHEDGHSEQVAADFAVWLKELPKFFED